MRKRVCYIILFSMLVGLSAFAFADFTDNSSFACVVGDYELEWGTQIGFLPEDFDCSIYQYELPYWGNPTKTTDYYAGFVVNPRWISPSFKFGPFCVEDVTLYFAKQFTPDGYSNEKNSAQLYMAKYELGSYYSKDEIKRFIAKCTEQFGEPLLVKKTTKSKLNRGNGWETAKTRHRDYMWTTSDNTAIRLKYAYESWHSCYTDVTVYIGRTDFDQSLKNGKLSGSQAFVQAIVTDTSIPLYNEDGSRQRDIKKGSELLITNYDSTSEMFSADVVVRGSSVTTSGDSIYASGWASEYSGFVTGKGLSISRKDLRHYFRDGSLPVPTPTPTLEPIPEPSLTPAFEPTPTPSPVSTPTVKGSSGVSYSTNDKETVKKGNSGIYAYRNHGSSYSIYYIIDFDDGYVYSFSEGNSNSICERVKIEEGDLNSVLIITYHDGNDSWSYGLHFKWKNQPDHLIIEDNDGFEIDFRTTNLDDALRLMGNKMIIDY